MTRVDTRTMDFIDRYVAQMIIEKYEFDEIKAIRAFIESETYRMLSEPELEIYKISPRIVFNMWESEQLTGDPRNSKYIGNDENE